MKVLEAVKAKQGEWINVGDLAGQVEPQELAEAVRELLADSRFQAEPNPFGWRVTEADQEMAPVIGGEARHMIRWDES